MNGLNAEPGWRMRLRDVVELVAVEVEAADQRQDRAVARAAIDDEAPIRPAAAARSTSGPCRPRVSRMTAPRADALVAAGDLSVERARDELEAVAADARARRRRAMTALTSVGARVEHDGRHQIVAVGGVLEDPLERRLPLRRDRPAG